MTFPLIFSSSARIISLLLLASALQACSAVKLAYNQAPDLAYWYLDGYVDFSGAQSLQVKDDLSKLQAWHRRTQLPNYIDTLQKLRQKMPADVNAPEVCSILADMRRKFVVMTDQTQPVLVGMLDTMTSSQLDVMARKFDKGNAEFRDDYSQADKPTRQSKRYKQAVKRAEMLYGQLDDRQLEVVSTHIRTSRFSPDLAYAERQRRQQDTLQTLGTLLKNQAMTDQKRQAVRGLFERTIDSPNPVYAAYADALTQDNCKHFADLHNSTTASQRRKAAETLLGYEEDMKKLSARSSS